MSQNQNGISIRFSSRNSSQIVFRIESPPSQVVGETVPVDDDLALVPVPLDGADVVHVLLLPRRPRAPVEAQPVQLLGHVAAVALQQPEITKEFRGEGTILSLTLLYSRKKIG